jgi:hypothetical protein
VGVFRRNPTPTRTRPPANGHSRSSALTTRLHAVPTPAPVRGLPYNAYRPITAAARQVNLRNERDLDRLAKQLRNGDGWQQEAWEYYDAIGEVKFAFTIVSNLLSRVRLYAGFIPDVGALPLEADPETTGGQAAISALAKLDSVYGGQPGFVRDAALNLLVAGECYLVQIPAIPGDVDHQLDTWDIRSVDEVIVDVNRSVRLRTQRRQTTQDFEGPLPKNAFVARLWRPHPRFSDDADSSMLALRELCSELLLLNRTYRATARSRLNAGAMYIPDGLSVAAQPDSYDDDEDLDSSIDPALFAQPDAPDDNEDDFEDALIEAMVTPISDESSASSVVPLIIRGPAELGEKIKLFKFERAFDAALTARADRVLDRIMQGIDVPKDVVTGLANVKYCASDDTEILTDVGWRTRRELRVGDRVLTLNHETGLSEWQETLAVNAFDVVDEPMLRMENSTHSSLTTTDHRWPTVRKHRSYGERRTWATSGTLTAGDRIVTSAALLDPPQEVKYSDDLVELVGWFYTEGCYSPRVNRHWSGLGQSTEVNPQKVERIRAALTRLFGPSVETMSRSVAATYRSIGEPQWREGRSADGTFADFHFNHELTELLRPFFSDFKKKIIEPNFVRHLTRAQLQLFVDVSIAADGHGDDTLGMVWQDVPERLDAVEMACALLGITTRRIQEGKFLRITRRRPLVRPRPEHVTTELYTGVVWCPTTKNQTWFARRNGKSYFTGNSNAIQINQDLYKAHLEPLALLICDCLTTAFLRPAMQALGVSASEVEQYCVWYDPSQVTSQPNKSDDADAGIDRHLLSGSAWRSAHGFTDDDAPSPTEVVLSMLLDKGSITPELTEALFSVIAPDVMANVRAASQADNPAPLPPEVANALEGQDAPPDTSPPPPTPAPAPTPAPEQPPQPTPPEQLPPVVNSETLV